MELQVDIFLNVIYFGFVQGIVTCMATQPPSHLLSASDDNSLAITRMGSWQVLPEMMFFAHDEKVVA